MQGRFNNEALDRRQAEAIFREHLGSLQKRIMDGYIALLEEVGRHTHLIVMTFFWLEMTYWCIARCVFERVQERSKSPPVTATGGFWACRCLRPSSAVGQ